MKNNYSPTTQVINSIIASAPNYDLLTYLKEMNIATYDDSWMDIKKIEFYTGKSAVTIRRAINSKELKSTKENDTKGEEHCSRRSWVDDWMMRGGQSGYKKETKKAEL